MFFIVIAFMSCLLYYICVKVVSSEGMVKCLCHIFQKNTKKYNLLPRCSEHGGEVFEYPSNLLRKLEEYIKPEDQLDPYGFKSYEEYDLEIDRVAQRFANQPEVIALFTQFKSLVHEMNCKEQWSVLRYGRIFSLPQRRFKDIF